MSFADFALSPASPVRAFAWLRWAYKSALALGVYVGLAGMGLIMAARGAGIPLVWPAAGLGLVLVLRMGSWGAAIVATGAAVVAVATGASMGTAVATGIGEGAVVGLAALVLRLWLRGEELNFERLRHVGMFVACGMGLHGLLGALMRVASTWGEDGTGLGAVGTWWTSLALGVLVVAPALVTWEARGRMRLGISQGVEILGWMAALIFMGAAIFRNWAPSDTLRYPLELTMFPLMAWAAVRFGPRGVAVGNCVVALMAVTELRDVLGEAPGRSITQAPIYVWLFVGVLAMTALLVAAVVAELRAREAQVRTNEERLRAFVEALPDIAFVISEDGVYLDVFAPRRSVFAERARRFRGQTFKEAFPAALAEQMQAVVAAVLATGRVQVHRYLMEFRGDERWFEGRVAPLDPVPGEKRSVVWIAYDVTESHRAHAALRYRDGLLQTMTQVESNLLRQPDEQIALAEALAVMGPGMELEAALLLRHEPNAGGGLTVRHRWVAPHIDLPEVDLTSLEVVLGDELPDTGLLLPESTAIWKGRAPGTSFVVPVTTGADAWGVALYLREPRREAWSEQARAALQTLTHSVGSYLEARRAEDDLRRARDAANAANEAKGMFLAMMSHEIRTPMNAILGFTDLLHQSHPSTDQIEYLSIISRSGRDLLDLINNILDFSKLESQAVKLERTAFRLEACVMEALEIILIKAREKGLALTHVLEDPTNGEFLGDPLRLRQVILNLLTNAVKFTPQGGVDLRVRVEVEGTSRRRVRLEVRDTGIGIPADKKDLLFQAFTQVDSSTTRQYGGSGLGLSICKRLVERMQGRIWVESEEGRGSTFFVEVTLEAGSATRSARRVMADNDGLSHAFAEHFPLRIVLAEDDPGNARLAAELLQRLGYSPLRVSDGLEAVELVGQGEVDVVLMDVHMRRMDGLEATRRIRALKGPARDVYIAALTAFASPADERGCCEAGMDGYVAKPFHHTELQALLKDAYLAVNPPRGLLPR